MDITEIDDILDRQRRYFASGATLKVSARKDALRRLHSAIRSHEKDIADALHADLGKSAYESYMCETGLVLGEISYMTGHVNKFSRPRRVHTTMSQFPSRSYGLPTPYGNVLIMSPWNYPFLLTMDPLADAIAAGNTVILKPSAYSPATSRIVADIISECFSPEHVAVITGGRKENAALLEKKFDMIFFTGSQNVGKEVLRHAAETLTPAVLELGGKSPCIVDASAKIPLAAKRIVFGKFLNCGQTCVAPDYVLCERSVLDELVAELKKQITLQLGDDPISHPDYGKIINEKHFDRICGLIDADKTVVGGRSDRSALKIEPTVMTNVTCDDKVMGEEIFGPVLPIIAYDDFDQIFGMLEGRQKPLALYIFSENKQHINAVTYRCRYGGGCVNDVVIHLATSQLGFGGVGESGMGAYHGKTGFDAFSHLKSILHKSSKLDLPMRYRPYKPGSAFEKMIRFFLK